MWEGTRPERCSARRNGSGRNPNDRSPHRFGPHLHEDVDEHRPSDHGGDDPHGKTGGGQDPCDTVAYHQERGPETGGSGNQITAVRTDHQPHDMGCDETHESDGASKRDDDRSHHRHDDHEHYPQDLRVLPEGLHGGVLHGQKVDLLVHYHEERDADDRHRGHKGYAVPCRTPERTDSPDVRVRELLDRRTDLQQGVGRREHVHDGDADEDDRRGGHVLLERRDEDDRHRRDQSETETAIRQFENMVDQIAEQGIKIDMFAIPNDKTENEVSYGTKVTSGEQYTVGENQTIEEITAKYLFQTLQIEKIELGEAVSGEGNMTVDLQDTYMQKAKILLVSGENIEDFHVAGQCESLNMLQGNKFAVAELENPLERQITMDYSLENRGNVHTYLIKEYFLKADMEKSYTSEEGTFTLKVNVVNHQEKPVLDSETLKDSISVLINGKEASYRVENGTAMVPYQTDETAKVNVEIAIQPSGNVVHYIKTADTVELTVPVVEEEPDYTVLWIVIVSLCAVVLLLSVLYERKKKKKTMVRRVPLS